MNLRNNCPILKITSVLYVIGRFFYSFTHERGDVLETSGKPGIHFLHNNKGDISIYTCFFIIGIIALVSFLLLYSSVRINSINIRNAVKMELNNLSARIYADVYKSQRESNFDDYISTLYSSDSYIQPFVTKNT